MNAASVLRLFKKPEEGVTIGQVTNSLWQKEILTEGQLNHHVHVVGASGFGKTVLLMHIIRDRIQKGKGLLFIDLKGDVETLKKLSGYAADAGRLSDVQIFSLADHAASAPYNFIQDGTSTQLRDRIMLSLNWSEEYYKNQSSSYLLKLLIGLCHLRNRHKLPFHLGTILEAADKIDFLKGLIKRVPLDELKVREVMESCLHFLSSPDNHRSLQGLRTQLESITFSDFGDLVTNPNPGLNLFETVAQGKIAFIFLDSRRYGETAKTVGRFILQDLKSVSAKIDAEIEESNRKPFSVVIDEFADLAQEDFIGFLDRARSSKMSIVVAHQEICDLQRISPEFAGRLMGNTSTLYAFLQKRPESAEIISGIAGTRTVWKTTRQTERRLFLEMDTGSGSKREVEEFVVHPNTVKSLGVGKCICVKKYPLAVAHVVEVNSEMSS